MNAGSILTEATKPGAVFALLRTSPGRWFGGWELTMAAQVTAIGTRISEIRDRLRAGQAPGWQVEHEQRGTRHFYRVVRTAPGEQLDFLNHEGHEDHEGIAV